MSNKIAETRVYFFFFFYHFPGVQGLIFHVNRHRRFTRKIKPCFLYNNNLKKINISSAAVVVRFKGLHVLETPHQFNVYGLKPRVVWNEAAMGKVLVVHGKPHRLTENQLKRSS